MDVHRTEVSNEPISDHFSLNVNLLIAFIEIQKELS